MSHSALWTTELIREIKNKSVSAGDTMRGFGANRPFPTLDGLVVIPAQLHGPAAVDRYRDAVRTKVVIGEGLPQPLVLETPVFIPAMSFGAIGREGKMALAHAASQTGTATNTGEGGGLDAEREICQSGNGKLVVQWSTGRFGVNLRYLRSADAIEIKIGQGAKPGMGGHLLADKVTDQIASLRGIVPGKDALSPCRHLDVDQPGDLAGHVRLLRQVTGHRIPIILKLGPADVYEDVAAAIRLGVDAIAIDGAEGGTGCAPVVAIEHAGIPTIGLFAPIRRALADTGAAGKVKIMVMGGIRHGADVYKALALGADAVGMATASLIAMGCTACQQCMTGRCPAAIASQDESTLDWRAAGDRLARFLDRVTDEVRTLSALSGHDDVNSLSVSDVAALDWNVAAITGAPLIGYGPVCGPAV